MSVIGRLDEQVDAIFITPLKRRNEAEATPTETRKQPETSDGQPRSIAPHDDPAAQREAQPELPVCLL